MKKTAYLLFLVVVAEPLCLNAMQGIYEVIEKSDADKFRDFCSSALFTMSKEEKKAFLEASHRKVEERQLNVKNFILKDAGRLILGIPWAFSGMSAVFAGVAAGVLSFEDPLALVLAIPALALGSVNLYLGIDNIKKALSHYDNKIKLDRALAIEAMIRRNKAKSTLK